MTKQHWPECWRYASHHACAVAKVERLQAILGEEGQTLMVEALREKAANLSGFLGKVGTIRGAEAVTQYEDRIQQIKNLADRLEGHCE